MKSRILMLVAVMVLGGAGLEVSTVDVGAFWTVCCQGGETLLRKFASPE